MVRTFRALMLLACLASAGSAFAQNARGHIAGVVTDEQGQPVRGVFVTAHGTDQSQRITTGSDGEYLLHDLAAGRYVLTAALDGYTTVVRNGVMVHVGKTAALPLVMKIAEAGSAQTRVQTPLTARFRGLTGETSLDGSLPSYNPIESLPPSTALLVEQRARQIR
jgi:uncharacterized surface anchored protein